MPHISAADSIGPGIQNLTCKTSSVEDHVATTGRPVLYRAPAATGCPTGLTRVVYPPDLPEDTTRDTLGDFQGENHQDTPGYPQDML